MNDARTVLAEWQQRTDAATEGPWVASDPHPFLPGAQVKLYGPKWNPIRIERATERHVHPTKDAEFIVAAREAMPKLLAAVEAVLALCDEAEPRGLDAGLVRGMVGIREVRRAINDALLASEPSGSEQ
jgi:hypothetical protein